MRGFRPFLKDYEDPSTRLAQSWFSSGEGIDLEIGCGVGWHPIQYGIQHPKRRLIAIEHTRQKFARFEHRLQQNHGLENVLAIHANALSWVPSVVPPQSIKRCFLLFPNPNPKAKHRNQRWHNMPFMSFLKTRLCQGGELMMATNEGWYLKEAMAVMTKNFGFQLQQQRRLQRDSDPDHKVRTHFEKKYFEAGQSIYEAVWIRQGDASLLC